MYYCTATENCEYSREHEFDHWKKAPGTVVMKDLLTKARFHSNAGDWLFLFTNCILKTVNEAVVEGMCKIVHKHANPERNLSIERFAMEAVIDWNGPSTHKDFFLRFENSFLCVDGLFVTVV